MDACKQAKVAYLEIPIAFDAITVAVNAQNTWAKDIMIAELKKLWGPSAEGKITNWKQIRSSYPDRPIVLYAPDQNAGTANSVCGASTDRSSKDVTFDQQSVDLEYCHPSWIL